MLAVTHFDEMMKTMSDPLEYSYEDKSDHLSDGDALAQYTRAKRERPNALIMLRDLDGGHWQIETYETDDEKNACLRNQLAYLVRTFWSALRPSLKTPPTGDR